MKYWSAVFLCIELLYCNMNSFRHEIMIMNEQNRRLYLNMTFLDSRQPIQMRLQISRVRPMVARFWDPSFGGANLLLTKTLSRKKDNQRFNTPLSMLTSGWACSNVLQWNIFRYITNIGSRWYYNKSARWR